jgi:ribonuclease P protein component
MAPRLATLPPDTLLVIRALPPAADASSAELAEDLDAGLRGALRKLTAGSR